MTINNVIAPDVSSSSLLRVGSIAAAGYLALLPFEHTTALENLLLLITLICVLLLSAKPPRTIQDIPSQWPVFLLWLVVALTSLGWSHDPTASLGAIWRDIVKTFLVFISFFILARRGASISLITAIVASTAIVFASLALYDFLVFKTWQGPHSPPRYDVGVSGLNWQPLFLISLFLKPIAYRRSLMVLCIIATIALLVVGLLGGSRSYVVSLLLGSTVLGLLQLRGKSIQRRHLLGWIATLTLLALAAWRLPTRALFEASDRQVLYGRTLEKILANPWLGTGFGHETDRAWYADTFSRMEEQWQFLSAVTHPHNIILSYMDQMGIAGLLVLLALTAAIARPLWRAAVSPEPESAILGSGGILLLIFVAVSNTFNFYFARYHLWMAFALIGLILGWLARRQASPYAITEQQRDKPALKT